MERPVIFARVDPSTAEALKAEAERLGVPVSRLLEYIIREQLGLADPIRERLTQKRGR